MLYAMALTISSSNAHTLRFDLEAHASLILPQSCSHSGLHTRGSHLTTRIRILRSIAWRRAGGRSNVRMLSRPASSYRYCDQLESRSLVKEYWNYRVRAAVPNSSAHPSKRTLGDQAPTERLCCWDNRRTGRSLETAHNCQARVATVAAAVADS